MHTYVLDTEGPRMPVDAVKRWGGCLLTALRGPVWRALTPPNQCPRGEILAKRTVSQAGIDLGGGL